MYYGMHGAEMGINYNDIKKPVTYQDIEETASALQIQQKNVTGDNIREYLGRGSKGTITKYLQQWKLKNNITTVDEASIPKHILLMVRDLLKRVHEDADGKLNEHKEAIDLQLTQTQLTLKKVERENEMLVGERDQLRDDLKNVRSDHEQLQNTLTVVQNEKSALSERVSLLESNNNEHKNEIVRLHQLSKELNDRITQQHAELTTERKRHTEILENSRSNYETKLIEVRSNLNNTQLQKTELQTRFDLLSQSHDDLNSDLVSQKNNNASLQKNCDLLSADNFHIKDTVEKLNFQNKNLTETVENKNSENTDLYIQLKASENNNVSVKNTLDKLEHKMQILQEQFEKTAQEKAFLEGQLKQLQLTNHAETN